MPERKHDYVPRNAAQFNAFMLNLIDYARNKMEGQDAPWGGIPAERLSALSGAYDAFALVFRDALEPPTHANIMRRQEAQAETAAMLRGFVNQFLRFPPVTNPDRSEMGVPNHDTVRTDHTVVAEMADFVIHLSSIRELKIDFWVQGSGHKAKPAGYDGAVVIWGIRDAPPEKPEDLEHHAMASLTPFTLHFDEAERGKTVYIGLAWQNERGILGQWSAYKSAIVP